MPRKKLLQKLSDWSDKAVGWIIKGLSRLGNAPKNLRRAGKFIRETKRKREQDDE